MSDTETNGDVADPIIVTSRGGGVSLIWLLPVFALLLGAGITWQYYDNLGPEITITFASAEGVTPGATKVRYKHVDIGEVIAVGLDSGSDKVVISARIDKSAQHLLGSATRFWIVKPRAGLGGISGIGTILSGAYIDTDPGGTAGATGFAGLEDPPQTPLSRPGLRIALRSELESSVRVGSPVYYRQIQVGQVDGRTFSENFSVVEFDLFIQQAYADLVSTNSRFWRAGGLDIRVTTEGADIRTPSLEALLEGGISFDTAPRAGAGSPVANGAEFSLYPDRESAFQGSSSEKVTYLLYFEGSVRGLKPEAPVEFLGIPVGEVASIDLSYNSASNDVSIPVLVEIDPLLLFGEPLDAEEAKRRIGQLVLKGMKAQLKSASLVTGQLLVELAMYPDQEPGRITNDGSRPVLPSVPDTITQISQGLEGLVAKFNSLEIEPMLSEIRHLATATRNLVSSPAMKNLPERINTLADAIESLVEGKMTALTGTLSPEGKLHDQLVTTLAELREMADSLRQLSDTLVEKPNALLFGKSKPETTRKPVRSQYDRQ